MNPQEDILAEAMAQAVGEENADSGLPGYEFSRIMDICAGIAREVVAPLHRGIEGENDGLFCSTCSDNYMNQHDGFSQLPWPCPTMMALGVMT